MYRLVFVSLWTTYTVDIYPSIPAVQRDCAKRYGTKELTFTRDTDGILKAMIDADGEIVVLNLYETESAHAS
jgi:hypothetical protein